MVNSRFNQLLDLAREGDQNAVSDLWNEFQFGFNSKSSPSAPSVPSAVKKSSIEGGKSC